MLGMDCVSYWGDTDPIPGMSANDRNEHWRVVTDNGEARSYQCTSSDDCADFSKTFRNCCHSTFDRVPVCSRKESIHCGKNQCVNDEKWCESLKGELKCIPDQVGCLEEQNYAFLAIWIVIIFITGLSTWLGGVLAHFGTCPELAAILGGDTTKTDDDGFGQIFASYNRRYFYTGNMKFPEIPAWKFKYSVNFI